MYPRLCINLKKLEENVKAVLSLCDEHSIQITGITKCVCGSVEIGRVFAKAGLPMIGDARIANLKSLSEISVEKWLIRPPMPSEIDDVVRWADASVNSEMETVRALNRSACKLGKKHKVILMADLGDIREGFVDYQELIQAALEIESMQHITLYGIGTNLTCFSFIQPDTAKMQLLAALSEQIGQLIHRKLEIISGGNSATLNLMLGDGLPEKINNLRLGEALLFGRERSGYTYLPQTHHDIFTLECQIIELKEKPSLPWGCVGADSYGKKPHFIDRGPKRIKAICALGKQDFDYETTSPEDSNILMLGASSDHLILDVTDSKRMYKVGDIVTLTPGYFSTMRAYTSPYVQKIYGL